MEGFISVHRKIFDNWVWDDKPFSRGQAWLDILLLANHKDNKFPLGKEIVYVERGSFITSELKLMERWGWGKTKTRTFLKLLEDDNMIIKKSNNKQTTITVCNYNVYQFSANHNQTTDKLQTNLNQTMDKLQPYTNNNDNNANNVNKNKYSHLESDISEIRKLYPGNKNKAGAYKKLPKLIEKYGKEQLIRCIERYNQYVQNTRADGFASLQYKNESTFWNGGYIDYLDENVSQEIVSQSKEEVEYDNTRFTPEQLEAYYRTDPEDEDLPF